MHVYTKQKDEKKKKRINCRCAYTLQTDEGFSTNTHISLCHPESQERFTKGEALRLRTNSSEETFEENINNFKR